MTVRRRSAVCWLAALGMTAAMFALIFLVLDPQYAVNDDSGILRPFMGFETGEPAHFHIYLHGLLAWPLHWLGLAVPGVAWLSWMQLAFLFLASAVCQKSIMQRFAGAKKPLWLGALFALAFTCAFVLPYATRITFTQTAALLGAAAVLQILSVDHAEASYGAVLRGMGLALVLLVLAYALRQVAALPIACFCGAALLYVAARDDGFGRIKSIKPLVVSVVIAAVVMAGLTGLREWEIDANGARDYLAWQASTEDLMDRYGFEGIPQEELDRVGWSANTAAMVGSQWFFLDVSVSTEAFDQLTAYIRATRDMSLSARAGEAAQVLAAFPADNPAAMPSLWLLAAVIVLSAAGAALLPRGDRFRMLGALLLTVLLAAAMLCYLAFDKGRLPLRAALMALLPAAAMIFGLLPCALRGRGARALTALCTAACLGFCAWHLALQLPRLLPDEAHEAEFGNPVNDLLEYALMNEDMLIIHDITLVGDLRLFPDTSMGIPHNVSYWGGWSLRSRESIQQFANFGIDLLHFPPETFLRDDVLFATAVVDPPPNHLLNYLREKVDPNVDCMIYGENGFAYFFQFYIP